MSEYRAFVFRVYYKLLTVCLSVYLFVCLPVRQAVALSVLSFILLTNHFIFSFALLKLIAYGLVLQNSVSISVCCVLLVFMLYISLYCRYSLKKKARKKRKKKHAHIFC